MVRTSGDDFDGLNFVANADEGKNPGRLRSIGSMLIAFLSATIFVDRRQPKFSTSVIQSSLDGRLELCVLRITAR